ncbi:sodium-dependent transporter [Alkalihalobacterium chitinilyticum]|uniref:Sodium-dependent transporter n=1 Tax=Alkalihalobacterium chitinilyticum TaxID=2980103 RepID=A0ABT5VKG7_9BACI|nr:sodium-dependent transporter [Alkalihalobacterium chitinilyticum]MDE5414928.1 sodium-dependent transporter [Alkalihalobacterium chitinilyticum]
MSNQLGNQPREQWASRLGFILAAMGSAVGLGNIWRFSYVTGENGGAAFLILYFLCILLIGIPIMMAEFTIGRRAQSDVVGSFQTLAPNKPWFIGGFLGVASAFIILSFYGVIAGWTLYYFINYLTGTLWSAPPEGYGAYFESFITHPTHPILWQFIFMALTIGVVLIGVKNGIEKTNKLLMPILAILLLVLASYSLTLGGAKEGLAFLFSPDWSAFREPEVYLAALGQAFFSLSLGMGALITYGSYLSKEEKLPGAAYSVASLDTVFAVVAGIMIFPAVFAFGIEPGYGAGLAFVTLPDIFDSIAYGGFVGLAFFFLLAAAGLSSAVSLLEVAVAYFIRKFGWTRKFTAIVIGSFIFLLGIPSSLGLGVWSHITIFDRDILDSMDFLASNIFLPLGGLIIATFVGWGWNKSEAMKESDFGDTFIGHAWIFILRFIAPILIALVFLSAIGLFN